MVEPKLDPEVIHTEIDLLAAAIHIDRYVIDAMDRLEEDFAQIHSLTMQTFKQLSKNKHVLNDKVLNDEITPGEDVNCNLEKITLYNVQMEKIANSPKARLQRLCACCDRSFAFYGDIIKSTGDETIKLAAQDLASTALDRIGILRQALGSECGCDNLDS
ncbi:MAG: hypothetical protein IMF15_00830 [Proteobacteria bacterium]|nr:hypothetical protein [Pseudomonadota bacterium]